jgi:hypothetical protein
MEELKQLLAPLIDWLPVEVRDYWWAFFGVVALIVLLVLLAVLRRLWEALFGRRTVAVIQDFGPRENLDSYPLPAEPWGKRRLTVEGVPVRLRLVIMAPVGNQATVRESALGEMLDQLLWGLGGMAQRDQPRVRIWPPQLSQQGFTAAFQRTAQKAEADGEPSRWILVAGPTPARPRPFLLGLALWADQPTLIGRLNLEPRQWADVLRIQTLEE